MKTNKTEREIVTGGVVESNAFTVEVNSKTFKVLIDGLYSNKVKAVIRELWSNAFDSHIEAGKADTQFVCHMPHAMDPTFSVRDFGTSLSHEDVMSLYTTMFKSTKEDTNDQVGKLGLGSKSPFAYTDAFTVTAILDGSKRIYNAYISEDGVPVIALFSNTQSDEETGLEVSFPVKENDFYSFESNMRNVRRGFTNPPKLTGVEHIFEEPETILQGDGWKLYSDNSPVSGGARQGCVVYPINPESISDLGEIETAITGTKIVIDFPIGDLEIAASREDLGYDDKTQKNIRKRLISIGEEIRSEYQKQIDACETRFEASSLRNEMNADMPYRLRSTLIKNATYKGKPIKYIDLSKFLPNARGISLTILSKNILERRKSIRWDDNVYGNIDPNPDMIVVVDDGKSSRVPTRLRQHHDETGKNYIWIKSDPNSAIFKNFIIFMGNPPVMNVGDIKLPERVKKAPGERKKVSLKKWHSGLTFADYNGDVPEEGSIYVNLYKSNVCKHNTTDALHNATIMGGVISYLIEKGYMERGTVIYGVPGTYKTLPKRAKWVSLFDLFERAFKDNYVDDLAKVSDTLTVAKMF